MEGKRHFTARMDLQRHLLMRVAVITFNPALCSHNIVLVIKTNQNFMMGENVCFKISNLQKKNLTIQSISGSNLEGSGYPCLIFVSFLEEIPQKWHYLDIEAQWSSYSGGSLSFIHTNYLDKVKLIGIYIKNWRWYFQVLHICTKLCVYWVLCNILKEWSLIYWCISSTAKP